MADIHANFGYGALLRLQTKTASRMRLSFYFNETSCGYSFDHDVPPWRLRALRTAEAETFIAVSVFLDTSSGDSGRINGLFSLL